MLTATDTLSAIAVGIASLAWIYVAARLATRAWKRTMDEGNDNGSST